MPTPIPRQQTPPREHLLRSAPFSLRAADGDAPGDGLTLDGYAAVFGRETVIDSWEGRFKEVIAAGSMKKSFRERTPILQFDHGYHPLIGSIPIGAVEEVSEDDHGAHVVGRLHDNWLVQPVRDAISSGSVDGMSFRFTVVRDEWRTADGKVVKDEDELARLLWQTYSDEVPDDELLTRTLKELKVPELGPVVWPAYEATSVGVRSNDGPELRRVMARADAAMLDRLESSTTAVPAEPTAPPDGHPVEESENRNDAPPAEGHPSAVSPGLRDRIKRAAAGNRTYLSLALPKETP